MSDEPLDEAEDLDAEPAPPRPPRWDFPRIGSCVWPMGNVSDADFRFCTEPIEPGRVYCPQHTAQAYVRLILRKKAG